MNWFQKTNQMDPSPLYQIGQQVQSVLGEGSGLSSTINGTIIDIKIINGKSAYTIEIADGCLVDDYWAQPSYRLWGIRNNKITIWEDRLSPV